MKSLLAEKAEVIRLRKLGHSYQEILKVVPVAKSSISQWLQHISLTTKELDFLEKRMEERKDGARLRAAFTNRTRRLKREEEICKIAEKEFLEYIKEPLFVAGILLYWAEGAKKSGYFYFVNSDVEMHRLMLKWTKRYFQTGNAHCGWRLYIHKPYKDEKCEKWWSESLGLRPQEFEKTVFKFTPHKMKKNPVYKGCMRFSIYSRSLFVKLMAWQKLLIRYYNDAQLSGARSSIG